MTQFTTELLNFLFIISNSQLSEKYLCFGKTILEIEWYWINISRESKGMMWGSILVFLKAIEIWY